jgi:hypothetical protein
MKQKLVQYVSLFDANKVITASNKLPSETQYIKAQMKGRTFKNAEEKESFLRKMAHETKCECRHFTNPVPMSQRGAAGQSGRAVCGYRNCRHYEKDHP